ncbi:MAG: helix-turn-helix domain-containing protein [Chloroflexota bacterium]|nr:helix-turn-helix domain-containing protein [Chloroflexota bacterium]
MPAKRYHVFLTAAERTRLQRLLNGGTTAARTLTHARILLKADEGPGGPHERDAAIAAAIEVSEPTVERVRKRCATEGVEAALVHRPPRATTPPTLDGVQEAHLIALACSAPPEGHARWTLRLLAGRFVTLDCGVPVSHELVRRTLKKLRSSRG